MYNIVGGIVVLFAALAFIVGLREWARQPAESSDSQIGRDSQMRRGIFYDLSGSSKISAVVCFVLAIAFASVAAVIFVVPYLTSGGE